MSIIDQLKWRYATKKFDSNKQLSEAQINTLKEAFNLTALSYGLQTLKLIVIKDQAIKRDMVSVAYGQQQVKDASHVLVLCIQNEIGDEDVDTHFTNVKHLRNTPNDILEPFRAQLKSTIQAMPESDKVHWAKCQAYIALGNLMTVCAAERIDSCPMEGFIPEKLDHLLGLDELGLNSVLLLPVGFRAEDDMFSQLKKVRKPLEETIIEFN